MIRLSLRAIIALCAAMAVYIALLNWRGQRNKQDVNHQNLIELTENLRKSKHKLRDRLPAIGEIAENEILAKTNFFESSLIAWIRENQEATISWALSLESPEKKAIVFSSLLPIWMKEHQRQCSIWLMDNQSQLFVEKGLLAAIDERSKESPYSGVKMALQLKDRKKRSIALKNSFEIWVDKNPLQAVSYLEDLASLPEYNDLNLLVLSRWSQRDEEKAYIWLRESKIDNRDELFSFIFLLNMRSTPIKHLQWIFKHLEPQYRSSYAGKVILGTYKFHQKAIEKFISKQPSYIKDVLNGWVAVYIAESGNKTYADLLKKIKSLKLKQSFAEKCYLSFSRKYPEQLMNMLSSAELRGLNQKVRDTILLNFAEQMPKQALAWVQSKDSESLIKEIVYYSQDDSVSGMTKNLQLASYFANSYPLIVQDEPEIIGLFAEDYQKASIVYNDYLKLIEKMISTAISKQLKKKNDLKVLEFRKSMEDGEFKDLYTAIFLMHQDYDFDIHSIRYFKELKNQGIRDRVLNFIAWKVDGVNAEKFAEYAGDTGLLNYSLVSIILEKWASQDEKKAGQWLHNHHASTWYIPACAVFSRILLQKSLVEFKNFVYGIDAKKRNIFVNKLTIVLSESTPELLAILPGAINIKKYLQTSKKEN